MEEIGSLKPRTLAQRYDLKSRMSLTEELPIRRKSVARLARRAQEHLMRERLGLGGDDSDSDDMPERSSREEQHRAALTASEISQALIAVVAHEETCSGFFDAQEAERFRQIVAARGNGFFLRGWRRTLDFEGALEIPFSSFCKVCAELGFVRTPSDLYEQPHQFTHILLMQVNPELGGLLEAFRRWILVKYEGHAAFFDAFDSHQLGYLDMAGFNRACESEGFLVPEHHANEIYSACDVKGNGMVTRDDVVFLEKDPGVRERELLQIKKRKLYEFEKRFVDSYKEDLKSALPPCNRFSIRPWIAKHFEDIPEVERQRKAHHEKKRVQAGLEARVQFLRHIRQLHGNEVTAWRRCLDKEGRYEVAKTSFRQVCRQLDFPGDIDALWYSLDPDSDGTLSLEQLSPHAADLLARFRLWATQKFGSCASLFQSEESVSRRRKKHPHREGDSLILKNMTSQSFTQLVRFYKCPLIEGEHGKSQIWFICKCLDFNGCGFIYNCDLEWLDNWEPSDWLTAEVNQDAWEELKVLLLREYDHLLRAWRFELDADNSNRLSWKEFRDACDRMRFRGDVGGAWRVLDKDLVGWISLAAVDKESSEILHFFKEWAETRFGTVELAFKAIGGDSNSGQFSYTEMRIACNKFKWTGNVRLLFDCLTKNGETVCYKDASFLSAWGVSDHDNVERLKRTLECLWREMLSVCRFTQKKPPLAVCEESPSQNRRSPSVAWGGQSLSPKAMVANFLENLAKEEASQHTQSVLSLAESMYSVPEDKCSPRAVFPGSPYAAPVVSCQEGLLQLHVRKLGTAGSLLKSSSHPGLLQSSPCGHAGAMPPDGDLIDLPMGKKRILPNGRFPKLSKNGNRLVRKRELIGSFGGGLSCDRPHSQAKARLKQQPPIDICLAA